MSHSTGLAMPDLQKDSGVVKYGALSVALVAALVAISAALSLLDPESKTAKALRNLSFFVDPHNQQIQVLEQQSQALLEPLEFMVWPQTRARAGQAYAQSLHRQINLSPFNAELWAQLVYAQSEAGTALAQQRWVMQRGLSLGRWNDRQRYLITRPCIIDYPLIMQQQAEPLCAQLLAKLPTNKSVDSLARRLGVSPKPLLKVLVEQGLRNEEGEPL